MGDLGGYFDDQSYDYNCSFNLTTDTYNMTADHFLFCARGPKRLPMSVLLPITIVYVGIFVTGVIGNMAVCVVIVNNTSLHTATNYYLFSLAVSDLTLLLLGLPNDLGVYWQQYPWVLGEGLCKFRALISEMTNYTSVLTIVAFSMERYLAICHPLLSYAMSGLRRAIRIIAGLWLLAFLCATPFAMYTTVNYLDFPHGSGERLVDSAFCAMLEIPAYPMYELSFIFFFLIPMLVILLMYTRIGFRIRSRSRHSLGKRVEGTVHGETKRSQGRKSIIRMLMAVVSTFFLCWAPFHTQRLIFLYGQQVEYFQSINEWLFLYSGVFYYVSSTVNPILYNVMSVKYRQAFKQTLCCRGSRSHLGFARDQSSFRETMVDVASPQWTRAMTWKRTQSKRPNNVSSNAGGADIVVQLIPDEEKDKFHWSKTLFRVTMGRSNSSLSVVKTKQTGDVNSKVCIGLEKETCI
uniref:Neuropeptides capa receptor n=1 Tax=Cacopsylla melanoneura TaxID=428564 RepID=A0A8D8W4H4_9HEMI